MIKKPNDKLIPTLLMLIVMLGLSSQSFAANEIERWQAPFDSSYVDMQQEELLSFDHVLKLVARENPVLKSLEWKLKSAKENIHQAGLWQNPELETEMEEVGWDAPGFSESEITIGLSQEFELFGQRKARKKVAQTAYNVANFETIIEAFDLFLDVKERFYILQHAQMQTELADSSVILAENIVNSISYRMKQGVALHSELLLAQLELQRVDLARREAYQELFSAQVKLAALWNSNSTNIIVVAVEEPDLQIAITKLSVLTQHLDSTRYMRKLYLEKEISHAERQLAAAEAKPGIILSGGYKRLRENDSNSFIVGLSLPLPLINRNQGKTAALDAYMQSQEYEIERSRLATSAYISSNISGLNQYISKHMDLDTLLLPTAIDVYQTLQEAYEVGRVPYTSLLEAERALIELRFEHNDVLFAINKQLIALEKISGIRLDE